MKSQTARANGPIFEPKKKTAWRKLKGKSSTSLSQATETIPKVPPAELGGPREAPTEDPA